MKIITLAAAGIVTTTWQFVRTANAQQSAVVAAASANEAREGTKTSRDEERISELLQRLQLQRAEAHLQMDELAFGLATLARLLRDDPTNRVAAERLSNLLIERGHLYSPVLHTLGDELRRMPDDPNRHLWDPTTNRLAAELIAKEKLQQFAQLSSDGRRLLTMGLPFETVENPHPPIIKAVDNRTARCPTVRVWDLRSKQLLGESMGFANFARFSPDGNFVASALGAVVQIRDVRTGKVVGAPMPHDRWVETFQFSPDGQRLLTSTEWKKLRLWDTRTGQALTEAIQHDQYWSASFSRDGRYLVTPFDKKEAQLWDVKTGEALGEPIGKGDQSITSAQFSPDGDHVLTVLADGRVRLWEAHTGEPIGEAIHQKGSKSVQFSPDGQRILVLSEYAAGVWDPRTGQPVGILLLHKRRLKSAQFSPDGGRVLTASQEDGTARLWDAETGRRIGLAMVHEGSTVGSADFSPDGRLVVTASENGVTGDHARVWDAHTGEAVTQPIFHSGLKVVRFDSSGSKVRTDGRLISQVTSSGRELMKEGGIARVWDVRAGRPVAGWSEDRQAFKDWSGHILGMSPDTRLVVAEKDEIAQVWNIKTGLPVGRSMPQQAEVDLAQFSPDGTRLILCTDNRDEDVAHDEIARIWDTQTSLPVGAPMGFAQGVRSARFSPDGELLLTVTRGMARRSERKTAPSGIQVWNARTGEAIGQAIAHPGAMLAEFHPDGQRIVTASEIDGTARIWDARTGAPRGRAMDHGGKINFLALGEDGTRLLTADGTTAKVWDPDTGQLLSPPTPYEGTLRSVYLGNTRARFVTDSGEGISRLWTLDAGRPIGQPMRHHRMVASIQFSPDGARIATASYLDYYSGATRLWDTESGMPLCEPISASRSSLARFSPDGNRLVMIPDLGFRFWDAPPAPIPSPDWLPDWAEAVAGKRLTLGGFFEDVPIEKRSSLREQILASPDADYYTRAAKWFFSDRGDRSISPWSSHTVADYVERCIGENDISDLAEALRYSPGDVRAYALLGRLNYTDPRFRKETLLYRKLAEERSAIEQD